MAKELWDLRLGVLPIVAKEMKSKSTKEGVQKSLVQQLEGELTKVLDGTPKEVADGIFKVWLNFKKNNAKTIALAKKYPEFRSYLESIQSDDEAESLNLLRKNQ